MAYREFAYYYDVLNQNAAYDRLCGEIVKRLRRHGIKNGLVADLGCGTGEVSLRLAKHGYDMIAIDASEDMLAVFRDKLADQNRSDILLLHQPLESLDLYGTIRAAVSTFDTLNHISPDDIEDVFHKVSLFLEPGGIFLFDVNTPFKHRSVLADNTFTIESGDGVVCTWHNHSIQDGAATEIEVIIAQEGRELAREHFVEYAYPEDFWVEMLELQGMKVLEISDGEEFSSVFDETERYFFEASKGEG